MHDLAIAEDIIKTAKKKGRVSKITVEVGGLSAVSPRDLERTLGELTGWDVSVRTVDARVSCACGFGGAPKIGGRAHDVVLFECPRCGLIPKVVSGGGVRLVEVEVG